MSNAENFSMFSNLMKICKWWIYVKGWKWKNVYLCLIRLCTTLGRYSMFSRNWNKICFKIISLRVFNSCNQVIAAFLFLHVCIYSWIIQNICDTEVENTFWNDSFWSQFCTLQKPHILAGVCWLLFNPLCQTAIQILLTQSQKIFCTFLTWYNMMTGYRKSYL